VLPFQGEKIRQQREALVFDMTPMLFAFAAGAFVSIPLGPFGIWALHVYMREGLGSAIAVALGGVLGDVLIVIAYLFGGFISQKYFSTNLEELIRDVVSNGYVRGCAAIAIGIFLMVAAGREHRPNSKMSRFTLSFIGAIDPLNMPAIGFVVANFGIQDKAGFGNVVPVIVSFALGGFMMWLSCMWAFSHLHFLRSIVKVELFGLKITQPFLTLVLFTFGVAFLCGGIGYLLSHI
jgi:hypothetical protein